ncbi:neuromedin-B receptor-like [Menidia menidia]
MDGLPEAAGPNASASPGAWLEPAGACADAGADLGAHVAVRCVMTSVYALIVTVGLVGNVTLLRVLAGPGARRSVPGVFMCSLAAGDVLLLVTCVPADAARYFSEQWLLGGAACRLVPAVQMTSVGVSVFTLTALSADR